jgi:rubrerythrin
MGNGNGKKILSAPPKRLKKSKQKDTRLVTESENPARDLVKDLIYWLENDKTEPERKPGLHCSSLWKTCARRRILEAIHAGSLEKEQLTAGQRMTFDEGHALHDLIQNNYLGQWGRLWGDWICLSCSPGKDGEPGIVHQGTCPAKCPICGTPARYTDGTENIKYSEIFVEDTTLCYCGHCDGIILGRDMKTKRVFEFKTISKSQFKGLKEPKYAHVVQSHAYMNTFGLTEAFVLYWDKGSQCDWTKAPDGSWLSANPHLKCYLVQFDQALWDTMAQRIKDYHSADAFVETSPTVTDNDAMNRPRICSHVKCDLALDCPVRKPCFALPK